MRVRWVCFGVLLRQGDWGLLLSWSWKDDDGFGFWLNGLDWILEVSKEFFLVSPEIWGTSVLGLKDAGYTE